MSLFQTGLGARQNKGRIEQTVTVSMNLEIQRFIARLTRLNAVINIVL